MYHLVGVIDAPPNFSAETLVRMAIITGVSVGNKALERASNQYRCTELNLVTSSVTVQLLGVLADNSCMYNMPQLRLERSVASSDELL